MPADARRRVQGLKSNRPKAPNLPDGRRGRRYLHVDAGLAVENACLQAEALGLDSVVVGAFDDTAVARLLALLEDEEPLLLLPLGWPA